MQTHSENIFQIYPDRDPWQGSPCLAGELGSSPGHCQVDRFMLEWLRGAIPGSPGHGSFRIEHFHKFL